MSKSRSRFEMDQEEEYVKRILKVMISHRRKYR